MASPTFARVVDLAKAGHPPRDIAVIVGIKPSSAREFLKKARRGGEQIPYFKPPGRVLRKARTLHVNEETVKRLYKHALSLGVSTSELAADLLEKIVADDLVDAILDTGGDDD